MKTLTATVLGVSLFAANAWGGEAQSSPVSVDIAKFSCKELMAGNDHDRQSGIAFFHGYLAAKNNLATVDVSKASAQTDQVRDYCLSNPKSTVMDAFAKTGK